MWRKKIFLASGTSNERHLECFLLFFFFLLKAAVLHTVRGAPLVLHPQEGSKQCSYWLFCSKAFCVDCSPSSPSGGRYLAAWYLFFYLFCAIHHCSRCTRAYGHRLWKILCCLFSLISMVHGHLIASDCLVLLSQGNLWSAVPDDKMEYTELSKDSKLKLSM